MAGGHTLGIKQGAGPRNPRHPTRIRPGQMFFPLKGDRRLRAIVKHLDGEWVAVEREDGSAARLALDRLLATDAAGKGAHYRFHGWMHRPRGYRTEFRVIAVYAKRRLCVLALPEWDPTAQVEVPLGVLPEELRVEDAAGTCMADLSSPSAAALGIHACSQAKVREVSRGPRRSHPELLAEGQRYRRREDRAAFRLVGGVDADSARVAAWNGTRIVRLDRERLLAVGPDGHGLHYEYQGGGVVAMRRRLSSPRSRERAR